VLFMPPPLCSFVTYRPDRSGHANDSSLIVERHLTDIHLEFQSAS